MLEKIKVNGGKIVALNRDIIPKNKIGAKSGMAKRLINGETAGKLPK